MRRQVRDVHTVLVSARCDEPVAEDGVYGTAICGGELIFQNITLTMDPPLYPHKCNKCGRTENLKATFPSIEYR